MALKDSFYVVGIGGSAGGIKPLKKLISYIPTDSNAAFVVVQHLLRTQKSYLADILSLVTSTKVSRIMGGEHVQRNTIYVLPENSFVTIERGELILRKRLPSELINYSIDIFFKSLGNHSGKKAIGIVLSGANEDGALGAKAITQNSGTVFVQDPNTAEYPNMPEAVIRLDSPVEINDPEKLAKALMEIIM